MDTFDIERNFLEFGSGDMGEIWNTSDMLESSLTEGDGDWSTYDDQPESVILRDRMITEANLPIKSEHSYCNDTGAAQSEIIVKEEDDMESECFPAISMSTATSGSIPEPDSLSKEETTGRTVEAVQRPSVASPASDVKQEPRPCPASPLPGQVAPRRLVLTQPRDAVQLLRADRACATAIATAAATVATAGTTTQHIRIPAGQSVLRNQTIVLTTSRPPMVTNNADGTSSYPRLSVKIEPNTAFTLPPTPPSSSDSEGSSSPTHSSSSGAAAVSPVRTLLHRTPKVFVTAGRPTVMRTFNTPLISTQPKGGYGALFLTDEEKRTLVTEGYPIPTKLPLSKSEERSLKKIRRKIKNKISAQESRRKKKEYMDQLERRVDQLLAENDSFKQRLAQLESQQRELTGRNSQLETRNGQLSQQLAQLQRLIAPSDLPAQCGADPAPLPAAGK